MKSLVTISFFINDFSYETWFVAIAVLWDKGSVNFILIDNLSVIVFGLFWVDVNQVPACGFGGLPNLFLYLTYS